MALNNTKVRARVVVAIVCSRAFLPFFPDDVMTGNSISGRYCALQTADQSERAANDSAPNCRECRHAGRIFDQRRALFTNLQPCIGLREIDIAAAL